MICLEREISSRDLHFSMSLIELAIPFVDQLVCFNIDWPFLFYLHLGHFSIREIRRVEEEEKEEEEEPRVSQDLSPGRK
jgi:hypothetical protein